MELKENILNIWNNDILYILSFIIKLNQFNIYLKIDIKQ